MVFILWPFGRRLWLGAFCSKVEVDDGDFDFTLINFYIEPELSPWKIDLLPEIIDDVKERFPDEADIIVFCSASDDKEFCN
jgi:hypothetical protein